MHLRKFLLASLALNLALLAVIGVAIQRLGGLEYLAFKLRDGDGGSGYSVGRLEHLQALDQRGTAGKIVFVGDSITEAGEWGEFFGSANVINRGIGGDSMSRVLSRIESIAKTRPSKIFLMAGINDLAVLDHKQVFEQYQRTVKLVRAISPATRIYVQSTLPVNRSIRDTGRDNKEVSALNRLLARLPDGDPHIQWIDVGSALLDSDGDLSREYTHDGVHLNGKGYARWKAVVMPHVMDALGVTTATASR
jgi:lysophospholipase L1-like esterase